MSTLTLAPVPAPPARALDQRMESLRHANQVRSARAQLKRDLKAGRRSIVDVLLEPPDYLLTAKVSDLLLAVPKFGRVKVNHALSRAMIPASKTVGGLSARQRAELVGRLRGAQPLPRGLTWYQGQVLRHARELGAAHADEISARLDSTPSGVVAACRALTALGLLDAAGRPTAAAGTVLADLTAT